MLLNGDVFIMELENRNKVLNLWNMGIKNANTIHKLSRVNLKTIYRTMEKIKKRGHVKRAAGDVRPSILQRI